MRFVLSLCRCRVSLPTQVLPPRLCQMYSFVCLFVCVYAYIYKDIYVCMYCMYASTYVYMYVLKYLCKFKVILNGRIRNA